MANPAGMRKLTLIGAKHLLKGGHISKKTHGKMVKAAKAMKVPKLDADPKMDPSLGLPEPAPMAPQLPAEQPLQFGSLDPNILGAPAPAPSQSPAIGPPMGMLGGLY